MIRPDFPIAPFVLCFSFVFSFIFLFYLCLKKTIKIQKETTENNITQKKDLSPKKKLPYGIITYIFTATIGVYLLYPKGGGNNIILSFFITMTMMIIVIIMLFIGSNKKLKKNEEPEKNNYYTKEVIPKNEQEKSSLFFTIKSKRCEYNKIYSEEEIDKMRWELPIILDNILESSETIQFLLLMENEYSLSREQTKELSAEIVSVIIGISSPHRFILNIEGNMGIRREIARKIANETYKNIFSSVEDFLIGVHSCHYKNDEEEYHYPEETDSSLKCENCGSKEHHTNDCPHICKFCGSKEHPSKDCSYQPSELKCIYCGSKEHVSEHCPIYNHNCCRYCGSKEHVSEHCPNHTSWF